MNRFSTHLRIQTCAAKDLDTLTHALARAPALADSSEAAEVSGQARNFRQGLDRFEGFIHLALAYFMCDHNDLGSGVAGVELHDRLDGDLALAEAAAHVANHTRGVFCLETHIVALANVA